MIQLVILQFLWEEVIVMHINNHYVPQMYLRNWSKDGKTILVYRTLVSRKDIEWWSRKSIDKIGYIQHLYTQRIAEEETDQFELWLDQEIESPSKDVIDKLICGRSLTENDYVILARFIAAQIVRTPGYYAENRQQWTAVFKRALEGVIQDTIKNANSENYDKSKRDSVVSDLDVEQIPFKISIVKINDDDTTLLRADAVIGRSMWLWHIKRIVKISETILSRHKWIIIEAAPSIEWPTSDDPVIRLNYYDDNNYDFKGGINRKGSEILLPISPKHLLYTRVGFKQSTSVIKNNIKLCELIKKMILEHAFLQIYSRERQKNMFKYRPRTVDQNEYNRINEQLKNWHINQTEGEASYYNDSKEIDIY
jgi:hypothetical protein